MPKAKIYNQKGEKVGDIKLSDKIFGVKENKALVHQAMVAQMANERQVLAHTKDRSEVRGGGKKPWRQKGTGRARAGSTRSPIWIGGGVTFGPLKTRNFSKNINKKMKQKAIFMVLSDRVSDDSMTVLEELQVADFKTKIFNEIINQIEKSVFKKDKIENKSKKKEDGKSKSVKSKHKRSILIINDKKDEKIKYSVRNLSGVKMININNINIVDLLKYRNLILTVGGAKELEKKYVSNKKVKV